MECTVTEFRKKFREILDTVDGGQRVFLRRYDKIYEIISTNMKVGSPQRPAMVVQSNPAVKPINTPDQAKEAIQSLPKRDEIKFCPNGHAIPPGRTSCMGKGCKYAK